MASRKLELDAPLINDDLELTAAVLLPDEKLQMEEDRLATASGELYLPLRLQSLPLKIVLSFLLLPFIGFSWVGFGLSERLSQRVVGHNPNDWLVIVFIGFFHQLSLMGLIYTIYDPSCMRNKLPTDYYGTTIFYPLSILYLFAISLTYHVKKGSSRLMATNKKLERMEVSRVSVSTTKANAMQLLEEFRKETAVATWILIPFCSALAVIILIVIRLCIDRNGCYNYYDEVDQANATTWTRFDLPSANCSGNLFRPAPRSGDISFNIMNVFWWLLSAATTLCCVYSVVLFYQQVRQIEEFTYIKKYSKKRRLWGDVNDFSKDVAVWANVWQELLQGLNNRPISRAFISTNAIVSFLLVVGSSCYIVFQTVLKDLGIGELTTAFSALLAFNFVTLVLFVVVAVRMQRSIEFQVKSVSAAQNDLQREIDENKVNMGREEMLQKMSNCRVLSALDVYLTVFDNTPKIVGTISLESMRWIILLGGLTAMNIFFFALYVSKCTN
jgi:hypothetical protein